MEASSDGFSVVLFNMTSSDAGMNQSTRNDNMEVILSRVLDEMPTPLFILCQEKLNGERDKELTHKLRLWGFETKFVYTQKAGIACVWKSGAGSNSVRYVQDATLQRTLREVTVDENGNTVETNFKVNRLKACVIEAGRKKILLVSWHGPNRLFLEKRKEAFSMLVRFSERLRVQESCKVVILGGDFNLTGDHARAGLAEFNECDGTVCDDYQKPSDRKELKDYIVYWPKDQLAPPCTRPDFRSVLEKGSRPFDHPVVGFRFGDPVYKRLNQQAPRTRRIAEIISEIGKARMQSALPLRLCYHVQRISGPFSDGRVADKAVCRLLPDETSQHVNTEEDDTTLFLAIGKEERRKQYVDQMRAISLSGLTIGGEDFRVEFYYSSEWNPIPELDIVNPTRLFCIWCQCCTRSLDFNTSLSEQNCPAATLPWIDYAPGQTSMWLLTRVMNILLTRSEEEDINQLFLEFRRLMFLLDRRTQYVTFEEFEDIAHDWAENFLQKGERFKRHDVIDIKRIAECVQNHLPYAYGVVLKHERCRSQAASAGSGGTNRGTSGGNHSGGARTVTDMTRQDRGRASFPPRQVDLTSHASHRSEMPIRRSRDDDSPVGGVAGNRKQRRL